MRAGPADPSDIFSDNQRWGDVAAWNAAAAALHEKGGIHRVEREGFTPFWAVIDHAALIEIERQHERFTNEPEPVLQNDHIIKNRVGVIKSLIHTDAPLHTGSSGGSRTTGSSRRASAAWMTRLAALSRRGGGEAREAGWAM